MTQNLKEIREDYRKYYHGMILQGEMVVVDKVLRFLEEKGLIGYSFQERVNEWMLACFGPEISADKIERNHRFLEEALELVQANSCTQSEAHQLVDYVFNRDIGEVNQEVGGTMVTLMALCTTLGVDVNQASETELQRIWGKIEQIRAKQASKPKHSPLPQKGPEDEP